MTKEQTNTYPENQFNVIKVWSQKQRPLMEVGVMELNYNLENYFVKVEQSNIVPGIDLSPAKMLQGLVFAYTNANHYR